MKINKHGGQASRLLLVLAIVIFVAIIITYLVIKMTERPPSPEPNPEIPLPAYEKTLGDIRFVFESALDKGQILKASDIKNSQYASQKNDLVISNTGAEFIQVTIGAQNVGTENTKPNIWDIENVVDSKGRNFIPLEMIVANPWLPNSNPCGALLKPAFAPTPCTKIYEVSKESTGLKIRVKSDKDSSLVDLIVK